MMFEKICRNRSCGRFPDSSGGGRCLPNRKDNLSGGDAFVKGVRPFRAVATVRGGEPGEGGERRTAARAEREKEKNLQKAAVAVRQRFGKNALLKGSSLEEGATARERNRQIGGHKA